eukprot:scaffold53081_cov61-Phaeocystis_antarctica.AAC.4
MTRARWAGARSPPRPLSLASLARRGLSFRPQRAALRKRVGFWSGGWSPQGLGLGCTPTPNCHAFLESLRLDVDVSDGVDSATTPAAPDAAWIVKRHTTVAALQASGPRAVLSVDSLDQGPPCA